MNPCTILLLLVLTIIPPAEEAFERLMSIVGFVTDHPPTEEYTLRKKLGRGRYGTVYKATRHKKLGMSEAVAVKIVDLHKPGNPKQLKQKENTIINEIELGRTISQTNQRNLLKFYESYLVKKVGFGKIRFQPRQLWLVNEYVDGVILGLLMRYVTLSEAQVAHIVRQLLDAMNALHQIGIFHCDAHGGNIMVTATGLVKLIDYGRAVRENSKKALKCQIQDWSKLKKVFNDLFETRWKQTNQNASPDFISFHQASQASPNEEASEIAKAFDVLRSHPFLSLPNAEIGDSFFESVSDLKSSTKIKGTRVLVLRKGETSHSKRK